MELSPFLKHFPLIIKFGTTFNQATGRLNYPVLLWATICGLTLFGCNIATCVQNGLKNEVLYGHAYEMFILSFFILNVPILISNTPDIPKLIQLLRQPFDQLLLSSNRPEIVKQYVKWINIFGMFNVINHAFIMPALIMCIGTLASIPFYPPNTPVQDLPLPFGRIPFHTDSYLVYAIGFFVSSTSTWCNLLFYSIWFMTFIYGCLNIRAKLKMLQNVLLTLDDLAELRCTATFGHNQQDGTNPGDHGTVVRTDLRDRLLKNCASVILKEAVCLHLEILRNVTLLERTFRMSLLIFTHACVFVIAIMMLQLKHVPTLTVQDYLYQGNIIVASLFTIGVWSVCGQTIITESMKLNRATYGCNWIDKSPSFKRSLLIMMTVSSRRLCVNVGGMHPLRMVYYRNCLNALYSYVNLMFTMQGN